MPPAKQSARRTRVKGETVKSQNTVALLQRIGTTKASRLLGVSTTTLHKARNTGIVSKVIEVAAASALMKAPLASSVQDAPATPPAVSVPSGNDLTPIPGSQLVLLEVPMQHVAFVQQVAKLLGANFLMS